MEQRKARSPNGWLFDEFFKQSVIHLLALAASYHWKPVPPLEPTEAAVPSDSELKN
jgi:hypothetical protein